jgi:hypothetical protein
LRATSIAIIIQGLLRRKYNAEGQAERAGGRTMPFRSAFFAFPNQPEELKVPIAAAVELANKRDDVRVQSWPQLNIFGTAIPDTIRAAIEKTDVLVCDITTPNLNVYYEVGFCIGLGKSIAPVINVSFANATSNIQKDGLFDIIGYGSYASSTDLAGLLATLPDTVLRDLYGKPLNTSQPVYFLSTYRKTDFVNWIAAAIKDSKVDFRTFDPAESPRFSIIAAIADLTSSAGVVLPFLEPYVDDAERHNVRASFLAGLAHGLGREAFLIRYAAPGAAPAAADFREDVIALSSEQVVTDRVQAFCKNTLIAAQQIKAPRTTRTPSALQKLTLGATAAENEFRMLEDYFVETSEFLRTLRGEVSIVAGRKGSGKTAIFFMVRNSYRDEKTSVLSDLRPESHQLSLFKTELAIAAHSITRSRASGTSSYSPRCCCRSSANWRFGRATGPTCTERLKTWSASSIGLEFPRVATSPPASIGCRRMCLTKSSAAPRPANSSLLRS